MDFHPNMLANQRVPVSPTMPNAGRGAFHPHMLSRQQLSGLDAVMAPQPPQAVSVDWSRGVIIIGGNEIKIVSAILTSVLVKLVFFGGEHAGRAAKHALGKLRSRGAAPAATTNPGRSAKPWQAVVFGPHGKRIAQTRCRTESAGDAFVARHPKGVYSRVSYVG